MKIFFFCSFFLTILTSTSFCQTVIDSKGTRIFIDSSKWKLSGNHLINKNTGNIGIGTTLPTAQLHTTGSIRFEGLTNNTSFSRILTGDANGNISFRTFTSLINAETNAITNGILSQVPSQTIKGRSSTGVGNVEDLTAAQVTSMLNTFSTTNKGLVPPSGGDTTQFLRADGIFTTPSINRQRIMLTNDVTNSNATANTLEDLTGLSFSVVAGTMYRFYALIPYTSSSNTNGSRWTINTPSTSFLSYVSKYVQNATTETINYATAPNLPATCNNSSIASGNIATIEGFIVPSVNGRVQIRFASEGAGLAITAKAGASLEWW